jgi:hypothetical protein
VLPDSLLQITADGLYHHDTADSDSTLFEPMTVIVNLGIYHARNKAILRATMVMSSILQLLQRLKRFDWDDRHRLVAVSLLSLVLDRK